MFDSTADKVYFILAILAFVILFGLIALSCYCVVVYGDTPIKDCPAWVVWYMRKG